MANEENLQINKYSPMAVIAVLLGTIYAARVASYWHTSGRNMIDPTKPMTGADIRGWMPLEHLAERLSIPHEELCSVLGIPASTPPHTPLKDLENVIEVSQVRSILAQYLEHSTTAPGQATATIPPPAAVTPTSPPATMQTEHQPGSGQGTSKSSGTEPPPLPLGQVLPAAEIKGRMTLQQVSDQCGIPLATLYRELGLPDGTSANTPLRDLGNQISGFEVSLVRDIVTAFQAK